jgi:2-amino-4-hydroxy-6-hydroxymethyldihydropteridine diphosphokinase
VNVHLSYISIGSNLGDRLRNCCEGIAALEAGGSVQVVARSPFYETEPVDFLNQAWFLNAVIKIETSRAPLDLLNQLQAIQRAAGRKQGGVRFGPRILDLDILLYDQVVMESSALTIPHPRMHKRRFVLQPICDIDPAVVHPLLHADMKTLLAKLNPEGQTLKPCSYGC